MVFVVGLVLVVVGVVLVVVGVLLVLVMMRIRGTWNAPTAPCHHDKLWFQVHDSCCVVHESWSLVQ